MPNFTRLLKNAALFRSMEWAKAVQGSPVRFTRANARDMAKGIYVPEADVYIADKTRAGLVLLEDLGAVACAKSELKADFHFRDGRWLATFDGITLAMVNKVDPWLLTEIFLDGTYHFATAKPPTLAIDIGMNSGFASIYLAKKYGCEVHSYELCSPTFEAAEANMALNPELAKRIHRNCFGLSDKAESLEISYTESNSVVASMYDLEVGSSARKLPARVERASEALAPVLEKAGDGLVFAKLDCEGAEFPILRDLEAAGLLPKIGAMVMEWHSAAGDPQELVDILVRNGFTVFSQKWVDELGFLRAAR